MDVEINIEEKKQEMVNNYYNNHIHRNGNNEILIFSYYVRKLKKVIAQA